MKDNFTKYAYPLEIFNTLKGIAEGNWKEYNYALGEAVHTYTLMEIFQNLDLLSKKSLNKIKIFQDVWYRYIKNNAYGEDGLFVYFDPEWSKIIKEYLKPAIKSIEIDLATNEIKSDTIQAKQNIELRPLDLDILERGRALYKLLIKHKIIDKNYLD